MAKKSKAYIDVVDPVEEEFEVGGAEENNEFLLTEEECLEIEAEVALEIEEARRTIERDAFRKETKRRLRIAAGLEHAQIQVTIDLAGHSNKIMLDGREYHQGFSYVVPAPVYQTIADIMQRTWQHEEDVGGANRDEYRKPRQTVASADGSVRNAPTRQTNYAPKVVFPAQNVTTRAALHGR